MNLVTLREKLEKLEKRETRENSFYADLVDIMTTPPSFQNFCTKYMSSWTDMVSTS